MSDFKYEVNPYELKHLLSAPGLKPIDRFVYRELLDLCWMSDLRDRMTYKPEELSDYMGLTQEEIESSVLRLSNPDLKILSVFLDLDSDSDDMILAVSYLSSQIKEKAKISELKNKEKFSKSADDKNTIGVIDRISQRNSSFEPSVLYIERSEKALARDYTGWIPTRNYSETGEAYNVRDHVFSSIEREFENTNTLETLREIFHWLMKNPDKRPSMARVNGFIYQWFSKKNESLKKSMDNSEINQESADIFSTI